MDKSKYLGTMMTSRNIFRLHGYFGSSLRQHYYMIPVLDDFGNLVANRNTRHVYKLHHWNVSESSCIFSNKEQFDMQATMAATLRSPYFYMWDNEGKQVLFNKHYEGGGILSRVEQVRDLGHHADILEREHRAMKYDLQPHGLDSIYNRDEEESYRGL